MRIWIIMLLFVLLTPLLMIGFGFYFSKKAPRKINMFFGYRTEMSMKNKETWEFAHHHCGKVWHITGWVMLLISGIAMLLVLGKDENLVRIYGVVICCVQLIPLFGSIKPTEIALKKTFDENGNRIEK